MAEPSYRLSAGVPDFGIAQLRSIMSKRTFAKLKHSTDLLHPNVSCYNATKGGYCRNPDCKRHGNWERHRRATEWARYDPTTCDTYSVTLAFAGYVTESQYLAVRDHYRASVRKQLSGGGYKEYCFRTEFVSVVPHLHWLFRLPLGSDFGKVSAIVRACWKAALESVGIWNSQRVGIDLTGKTRYDLFKLSDYCYSTNYGSWRLSNCRPREWRSRMTYRSRGWADKSYTQTAAEAVAEIVAGLGLAEIEEGVAAPLPCAASADSFRSPAVDTLVAPHRKRTPQKQRRPKTRKLPTPKPLLSFTGCTVPDYCHPTGCAVPNYVGLSGALRVLSLRSVRHSPLECRRSPRPPVLARSGKDNTLNAPLPHAVQPRPPPTAAPARGTAAG